MQILIIDNYDSFTYNLAQYLGELGTKLTVRRNDKISLAEISLLNPDGIVISPGPGVPVDAGITLPAIREFGANIPILGVCLGHQAIGQAFGANIIRAATLMHGKTSRIFHEGDTLFSGFSSPFTAMRYHSLIIDESSVPECLEITARAEDNTIMGLAHREFPVAGVQFHPESFLTRDGKKLLSNFLEYYIACRSDDGGAAIHSKTYLG